MVLGTVSQDQLGSQGRVAGAGCRGGNLDHEPPGQRGHSCCCHHNCEERQQRVALAPPWPPCSLCLAGVITRLLGPVKI